jgi:hypothetical protein
MKISSTKKLSFYSTLFLLLFHFSANGQRDYGELFLDSIYTAETNIHSKNDNLIFILISPWVNGINFININLNDGSYQYVRTWSDTVIKVQGIINKKKKLNNIINLSKDMLGEKSIYEFSIDGPEYKIFILEKGVVRYSSYALGTFNNLIEEKLCNEITTSVKCPERNGR